MVRSLSFLSFRFYTPSKMEATIEIEFLKGANELVIKELAVVSDGVVQTFLFCAPYHLDPHGSDENGLNWNDGFIPYDQLFTVLNEAVAHYDHLYAMGNDKCQMLHGILANPYTITRHSGAPTPRNSSLRSTAT